RVPASARPSGEPSHRPAGSGHRKLMPGARRLREQGRHRHVALPRNRAHRPAAKATKLCHPSGGPPGIPPPSPPGPPPPGPAPPGPPPWLPGPSLLGLSTPPMPPPNPPHPHGFAAHVRIPRCLLQVVVVFQFRNLGVSRPSRREKTFPASG